MQIQERKLETIRPYPNNPRRNDEAVQAVAASIREFGWCLALLDTPIFYLLTRKQDQ